MWSFYLTQHARQRFYLEKNLSSEWSQVKVKNGNHSTRSSFYCFILSEFRVLVEYFRITLDLPRYEFLRNESINQSSNKLIAHSSFLISKAWMNYLSGCEAVGEGAYKNNLLYLKQVAINWLLYSQRLWINCGVSWLVSLPCLSSYTSAVKFKSRSCKFFL